MGNFASRKRAFLRAARDNDVDAIQKLHEKGDIRDMDTREPILEAVKHGNLSVLKLLVKLGVDITKNVYNPLHPIHAAAWKGHADIIEFLIKHGVITDLRDRNGQTPLFEACTYRRVDAVKTLIRNAANVNNTDDWGQSPLHCASRSGNTEIVNILIQNGSDVNCHDIHLQSPLGEAVENGSFDVVKTLIRNGADVNVCNSFGSGPIHVAADENRADIAFALIRNGCDYMVETRHYRISLLLYARMCHKYVFILKLIVMGVEFEFEDERLPSCMQTIVRRIRHQQKLLRNGKPFKCVLTAPERYYIYELAFVFAIRLRGMSLKALRQVRQYITMEHVVIAPGFVNHEMAMWRRVQIWEDQDMNEGV